MMIEEQTTLDIMHNHIGQLTHVCLDTGGYIVGTLEEVHSQYLVLNTNRSKKHYVVLRLISSFWFEVNKSEDE